jgi:hypothetical protein
MTIRQTLTAALAAAALVAPAAQAQPADMHASTAHAAAKAQRQDLRSPDARDAASAPSAPHHSGRYSYTPGANIDPASVPAAGQPTWPVNPQPIAAPAQEPATDNDGSPVPLIPLVAGLFGVVIAGFAARYGVHRAGRRTRVA